METTKRTITRPPPSITRQIVRHAEKQEETPVEREQTFVPTGSALLNLALSDKYDGGYLTGKLVNIIGDSSSGKTFLALTLLAECAHNPVFDDYLLVYDDSEAANEFNLEKLFGENAAKRILPPSLSSNQDDDPKYSHTILGLQSNVRRLLKGDKPIIYVLDSLDSLTTEEEMKHASELQKAHDTGKEIKGTYGMEKAKQIGILLRLAAADVKHTKSLVIFISQTRDNIDPMSFTKKTRSGGKALTFYVSVEFWMAVLNKLTTKINDKNRNIGVAPRIRITKNKYNGKMREISLKIYYSYGVDDVGSCVDFLIEEGAWTKNGTGHITSENLGYPPMRQDKLIASIEQDDKVDKLHRICQATWLDIEQQLELKRLPKYS